MCGFFFYSISTLVVETNTHMRNKNMSLFNLVLN